jgi:hypothetical protein
MVSVCTFLSFLSCSRAARAFLSSWSGTNGNNLPNMLGVSKKYTGTYFIREKCEKVKGTMWTCERKRRKGIKTLKWTHANKGNIKGKVGIWLGVN